MAITYVLGDQPIWALVDLNGTAAGGGYVVFKDSLNNNLDKPVFLDAAGTEAWPNPLVFDLNGVAPGAIYFTVDSTSPDNGYFLQAYNAQGGLLWEVENYLPGGTGGGGNTTTYVSLKNYIANNQFIDHIPDTTTTNITNLVIAPSNHKGFTPALINPVVAAQGVVGPDIRFVKNTTVNTDSITFPLFALASSPLTPDVTPVDYLRYQCTTSVAGETYKAFQFPITQKVKNLSNQIMTFKIWAAVTATPVTLTAYVLQYFGSGTAASAEVFNSIGTLSLTTTWTSFPLEFTVPDVSGKSIGTLNSQTDDDALYIQLQMPLSTACDILFTKPALYLGAINPNKEFDDYDQINSINSTPRTGDIRTSLSSSAPNGWVAMNDGSIGNVNSGATNRANKDTFQLYKTIWDGVLNTWAPVSTGRGASAIADFIANKTLTLPLSLGRALAGAGAGASLTSRALGQNVSTSETNTLTTSNLPNPILNNLGLISVASGGSGSTFLNNNNLGSGILANPGGGVAVNNMQPTSFFNVFIKL
jgi:hypothetical protein